MARERKLRFAPLAVALAPVTSFAFGQDPAKIDPSIYKCTLENKVQHLRTLLTSLSLHLGDWPRADLTVLRRSAMLRASARFIGSPRLHATESTAAG